MAVRRIPREAGATDTRRLTALFIALVFAHLLVVLVHTVAHLELQIVPPPTDTVFILGVILIGPVAALPILRFNRPLASGLLIVDRKSTRLNSSHVSISYAAFCLKKKSQELSH